MEGNEVHFRNHISTFPRLPGFHWWWQPTLGSKTDCLRLPKQVATLNPDFCSFGHVPLHSLSHRLVMIRNISSAPVTFAWDEHDMRLQQDGGFTIFPMTGRLDEGDHVMCKVSYLPVLRPELVEADIMCVVQPEEAEEEEDEAFVEEEEKAKKEAEALKAREVEAAAELGHQTLMERQQYAETRDDVASYATRSLP